MIQSLFQIVSNECIARNTYKMVLSGDVSSINRPGQFVNIKLKGFSCGVRFPSAILTGMKTR